MLATSGASDGSVCKAAQPAVGQVDLHCVDGLRGQQGEAVPCALAVDLDYSTLRLQLDCQQLGQAQACGNRTQVGKMVQAEVAHEAPRL